jgi:HlyD family secretion protein
MDAVTSMDRVIKKKKWTPRKIALYVGLPLGILALLGLAMSSVGSSRLKVQKERLSIATVQEGPFQEFIPINGEVRAQNTVFVTAIEGGQVKQIYLEGGEIVKKGDMILQLANPQVELSYMNLQTNLLEQADQLRNTKITLETSELLLKDQLVQIQFQVADLGQQFERNQKLFKDSVISEQEFMTLKNNYEQFLKREKLMLERIRKDSILRIQQLKQVDKSLALVDRNLDAIQASLSNLTITAPIPGQLSTVDVEWGEQVNQGQRIAQVDDLDGYKVRAQIDEHYISRITTGLKGQFPFDGQNHELIITKIYPEVTSGSFEVDMALVDEAPRGIKRGQNLQIRLALSDETQAILIPRGGFYQSTGGNYVYVLSDNGSRAYQRDIKINRQSDRHYEITRGLHPGERIITSSYDMFNEAQELVLQE